MRSGNVARTTADGDGSRTARVTENADIGSKTFAAFGARLDKSGFFQDQFTKNGAGTDARGERLSALRDNSRTTSSSERYSDLVSAIMAKVSDPNLSWNRGPLDTNAFWICTQ